MLSVIIPCYNNAQTISIQLNALSRQIFHGEWEIIVSNNGSTDGLEGVIKFYQGYLKSLRLVDSSEKKGVAFARNKAVNFAKGDKLIFCDADDEVDTGWIAAMDAALDRCNFVAGRLNTAKVNDSWVYNSRICPQENGLQEFNAPQFLPHAGGGNLGIRRCVHDAVNGFDETLLNLQDTDYCWRIQRTGIKLHFDGNAVVNYRLRKTFFGTFGQACNYGRNSVLLCKKYSHLGMPKISKVAWLTRWKGILKALIKVRRKPAFGRWLWRLAGTLDVYKEV